MSKLYIFSLSGSLLTALDTHPSTVIVGISMEAFETAPLESLDDPPKYNFHYI